LQGYLKGDMMATDIKQQSWEETTADGIRRRVFYKTSLGQTNSNCGTWLKTGEFNKASAKSLVSQRQPT